MQRARHCSVVTLLALLGCATLFADEGEVYFPERHASPAFSVLDVQAFTLPGIGRIAERVETPALADERRASEARGLEPLGPKAFAPFIGTKIERERRLFGAFAESALFGGLALSAGAQFGDGGAVTPIGRVDVALEYDKFLGEEASAKLLSAGLMGGLAGYVPFPWTLSGRVLFRDAAAEGGRGSLVLEAAHVLAVFDHGARLRAGGALGFEGVASEVAFIREEFFARGRLEFDARRYRGALARGVALHGEFEARYDFLGEGYRDRITLGLETAEVFGSAAGVASRFSFCALDTPRTDWALELRGIGDRKRAISGDLGATFRLELPLLFARGKLFTDPELGVEFFLKPFLDAALVRTDARSEFFAAENRYMCIGGELAMTIDRDRRQALRIFGGLDLSRAVRGESYAPGAEDIEVAALFSFVL